MKILLLFTLLSLVVLVAGPAAKVRAEGPTEGQSGVRAGNRAAVDNGPQEGFAGRFSLIERRYDIAPEATKLQNSKPAPNFESPAAIKSMDNDCVIHQKSFSAYGFYILEANTAQKVDFSVYSRAQYYALIPHWTGNISIPDSWDNDLKNLEKITKEAHRRGSKVDLVISNQNWFFEDGTEDIPGYKFDGLWLTKSYVLTTLIEDIAKTVQKHNFDGVTIDFRLPTDIGTVQSFTYFIDRLKNRLIEDAKEKGESDLLEFGDKHLNIVIDQTFLDRLAASYDNRTVRDVIYDYVPSADSKKAVENLSYANMQSIINYLPNANLEGLGDDQIDPGLVILKGLLGDELKDDLKEIREQTVNVLNDKRTTALTTLLKEVPGTIDLLFYSKEIGTQDVDEARINAVQAINNQSGVPEDDLPDLAAIVTNTAFSDTRAGIWDVTGEGKQWQTPEDSNGKSPLKNKILFFGGNPASKLVCTQRGKIANALTGLTPVLSLLVLVSWVFYDFPPRLKKSTSNSIIWGLLAVSFLAFILLLIGVPSINFGNIQLYIIIFAFVVPVIYLVWVIGTRAGKQNYP